MIRFLCECGEQLQAAEDNAGQWVLCSACGRQRIVPAEPPPPTAFQSAGPAAPAPAPEGVQQNRLIFPDEADLEKERDIAAWSLRQPAASSGKAFASLILGILSLFCSIVAGLPALIVGILALGDIGRSKGRLSGRGLAIAGIVCACTGTLLSGGVLLGLLLPAVVKVRDAAARAQSGNNLKQMALAMINYNDIEETLPPAAIGDPDKPPRARRALLSWRVAILPLLDRQDLYNRFKLDEPWDGPNNIKLLAEMPTIYKLPGDSSTTPGYTHYQVFVGHGAAFDQTVGHRLPEAFPDGTDNTILIVEAAEAVPWTKPEDLPFDPKKPIKPLLTSHYRGKFLVIMADASIRSVSSDVSEDTLKAAITRNGGEPLGADW